MIDCHRQVTESARVIAVASLLLALAGSATTAVAQSPAIDGYLPFTTLTSELQRLDREKRISLRSLGKSLEGREIWCATLGSGNQDRKPAILVLGAIHGPHRAGGELALRLVRRLSEDRSKKILDRVTIHVIPFPNPDASEGFFSRPFFERTLNHRPIDDDRDGSVNEDPPNDLDGDGWITQMRIADPAGDWRALPSDPRVLIPVDRKKDERGEFTLLTEGIDDDEDERYNEDGPGGVAFDRNFTFKYPYFGLGAGPNQVSEIESRAVADFAFDRPNIALLFSFSPRENLMRPWKSDGGFEKAKIKTTVAPADQPLLEFIGKVFQREIAAKDPPESPVGEGSPVDWAYFHFGRWSLASRGWWIPAKEAPPSKPTDAASKAPSKEASLNDKDSKEGKGKDSKEDDQRGVEDRRALEWFQENKIDGFVPWKAIQHPSVRNKKVEVGGFKPFVRLNPPAKELDQLADRHLSFLGKVVDLLPSMSLRDVKIDNLGSGVFRVTVTVFNGGFLPTTAAMGKITKEPHPMELSIELPPNARLVHGLARVRLEPIAGGSKFEHSWLLHADRVGPIRAVIRLHAPAVGEVLQDVTLP